MKKLLYLICVIIFCSSFVSYEKKGSSNMCCINNKMSNNIKVLFSTTMGDIEIKLFNETPVHRDNFIKNVKEGAYDGILFHRVIKDFMIQGGDPKSKTAKAGEMLGGSDYCAEIPAEFVYPELFHKKGAVAAARTGDNVNPEKKSSGSQFYIVTGKVFNNSELVQIEKNFQNRQMQALFENLVKDHRTEIMNLRRNRDSIGLQTLQELLIQQTKDSLDGNLFKFTDQQREIYTTIGGTPHLDNSYTVFGEVTKGMEIVEKIQSVATDANDRPVSDVRIIKAIVVE